MHHLHHALHPCGVGSDTHMRRLTRRGNGKAGALTALHPVPAVLCAGDYWRMQEHRRRCEELGGAECLRLARLIRARSSDARVVHADELPGDVVTGAARITFAIGNHRPETRRLYHWDFPARARGLPVGSFLGITLIGMAAGQRAQILDGGSVEQEVQVLAVHTQAPDKAPCI